MFVGICCRVFHFFVYTYWDWWCMGDSYIFLVMTGFLVINLSDLLEWKDWSFVFCPVTYTIESFHILKDISKAWCPQFFPHVLIVTDRWWYMLSFFFFLSLCFNWMLYCSRGRQQWAPRSTADRIHAGAFGPGSPSKAPTRRKAKGKRLVRWWSPSQQASSHGIQAFRWDEVRKIRRQARQGDTWQPWWCRANEWVQKYMHWRTCFRLMAFRLCRSLPPRKFKFTTLTYFTHFAFSLFIILYLTISRQLSTLQKSTDASSGLQYPSHHYLSPTPRSESLEFNKRP